MYRTRTITAFIAAAVLAVIAAGCGSGAQEGQAQQGEENVSLRLANHYEVDHPTNRCGVEPLVTQVSDNTDDSLTIDTFPGAQLGSEDELAQSLVSQNLEMAVLGTPILGTLYEPIDVLSAAYVFKNPNQMFEVTNGEIGQELWDGLREETNIRVLGSWYYGTRQMTTGDTEVRAPEDLSGVKLRATETPISIANIEALGASPTPIALEEVYLALQQGTVDGQENPFPTIDSLKFNEVQQYLILTGHSIQTNQVVIAESSWQRLSAEQQSALQDAVDAAAEEARECVEQEEQDLLTEWQEAGDFQVIEDIDAEAFQERARNTLPERFSDKWIDGMYERIQDAG